MRIIVYQDEKARFVLALSDVMNIQLVPIGSPRDQIAIDNTAGYWRGLPKRFFHRKEILNAILWAMIVVV